MTSILILMICMLVYFFSRESLWNRIMLTMQILNLYLIFCNNVLTRPLYENNLMLTPFWSYREWMNGNHQFFYEIVENILLFVPMGLFLGLLLPKASKQTKSGRKGSLLGSYPVRLCDAVLFMLGFSVVMELCQFYFRVGLCEFDDVFHNTLGGLLGYLPTSLLVHWIRRRLGKGSVQEDVTQKADCEDAGRNAVIPDDAD